MRSWRWMCFLYGDARARSLRFSTTNRGGVLDGTSSQVFQFCMCMFMAAPVLESFKK